MARTKKKRKRNASAPTGPTSITSNTDSRTNGADAEAQSSPIIVPGAKGPFALDDNDESRCSSSNHHSDSRYSLLSLEEQIHFQEEMLQSLIDRQTAIVQELERGRLQKRSLAERRETLQERQTQLSVSRIKHLTLQKEIHESLTKSQERLTRLASLEAEAQQEKEQTATSTENDKIENDNDNDDDKDNNNNISSNPGVYGVKEETNNDSTIKEDDERDKEQQSPADEQDGNSPEKNSDNDILDDVNNNKQKESSPSPLLEMNVDDTTASSDDAVAKKTALLFQDDDNDNSTMDFLTEFNWNHIASPTALWTFLPLLGPSHMRTISTLLAREAATNDNARRDLLWNTSLDLALLSKGAPAAATTIEKADDIANKKDDDQDVNGDYMDPNVSMCPYELSGVCADEFCPYQHTTKKGTLLARELLPLPPLDLGKGGDQKKDSTLKQVAVGSGKTTSTIRPEKEQRTAPVDSSIDFVTEVDQNEALEEPHGEEQKSGINSEEEDFMALPESSAIDNAMEEEGDEDDSDDSENFVSAYYKSVQWSFWWGGTVEECDKKLSIEAELHEWASLDPGKTPSEYTPWLGRMIDVCRILIHQGRIDVASRLSKNVLGRIRRDHGDGNILSIALQVENLHKSILLEDTHANSFFRTSFMVQTSLAVLSETVRGMHETTGDDDVASIVDSAHHCINAIMTKPSGGHTNSTPEVKEVVRLIISNFTPSDSSDASSSARRFQDLENGVRWAQTAFHPKSPLLGPLHNIEDEVLKPCWSLCTDWVRPNRQENEVDRVFKGLLATVVIGFASLGAFERFAAHIPLGEDKLNAHMTASLIEVDSTINRLLGRLHDELSDLPLFNILFAPLSAVSVSCATFLKMYSKAQNRLELALQLNRNNSSRGHNSALMASLSELLWSQLFQLRMTLPQQDESTSSSSGEYRDSEQQPNAAKDSNGILVERMKACGVRLNHIALPGDSLLARAMSNENPSQTKRMKQKVAKNLQALSATLLKTIYTTNKKNDDGEMGAAIAVRNVSMDSRMDGHGRTVSPAISTLPRSLLLAGKQIRTLCLEQCNLSCLPISFGFYFPNLTSLDLSKNQLRGLPSSFKALAKLEEFRGCHNQIEELGEIAGRELKRLFVSHNKIASVSLPTKKWLQLEEINLSNNCLEISDSELALWTVRFKKLIRLDYRPQTPHSSPTTPRTIDRKVKDGRGDDTKTEV